MNTRLNAYIRNRLKDLASSLISTSQETAEVEKDYISAAAAAVRAVVERVLPPDDMRMLQRYDAARIDNCIRLTSEAGGWWHTFYFRDGEGPLSTNCRTFLVGASEIQLVERYKSAEKEQKEAFARKLNDYRALIDHAKYFEDVVEVWPEAETLRGS